MRVHRRQKSLANVAYACILVGSHRANLRCASTIVTRMPRTDADNGKGYQQESLHSLVYRYFFFQWLFFDMTRARGAIERRAAWLHNQSQREWLPAYMRRWALLSTMGFALGAISERTFTAPTFAACLYTASCICVSVFAVIVEVWVFLGRNQPL
jgi:hypothetical protein